MRLTLAIVAAFLPGAGHTATLSMPVNAVQTWTLTSPGDGGTFATSPFRGGQITRLTLPGAFHSEVWRINQFSKTTQQVMTTLRQQLIAQGYDIVFECRDADCGGFDFRYALDLVPEPDMHVDLGDYRFLTARRDTDGAVDDYVSVMVSRSSATGFVQIDSLRQPGSSETVIASSQSLDTDAPPAVLPSDLIEVLQTRGSAPLDDLTFETGSADLGQGRFASLAALAAYLQANPGQTVALVGHTDFQGSLAGNIALSRKRAVSVMDRLMRAYGIPASQLSADGVGYLAPRASNLTAAGRTENRRVEVILTPTQ